MLKLAIQTAGEVDSLQRQAVDPTLPAGEQPVATPASSTTTAP